MTAYSSYIFRMPEGCPYLDFTSLKAYIRAAYNSEDLHFTDHAEIGTTVRVVWHGSRRPRLELPPSIAFELYGFTAAEIYPDRVGFAAADDPHMATTAWLSRIVYDNAIGHGVSRVRRRKADGEGPPIARGHAGLLVIDGNRDKLVTGQSYPVGDIESQRRKDAEQQTARAAARERYAEESRQREALKTWRHPQYGWLYAVEEHHLDHGYHWRVMDSTFCDTIGYIRDCRVGPGQPAHQASPYPGSKIPLLTTLAGGDAAWLPVFTAFAGGADHRQDALGTFCTIAEALAAIAGAQPA
jgi:hypothetical protein